MVRLSFENQMRHWSHCGHSDRLRYNDTELNEQTLLPEEADIFRIRAYVYCPYFIAHFAYRLLVASG